MTEEQKTETALESFEQFHLSKPLMRAVDEVGYEAPTPIQLRTIPLLLAGRNVIGQAQTGTGKTAAFALPILQKLDLGRNAVQALILTPTRELSIQVAEAFHTYSKHLGQVRVLPIYGGQPIQKQLGKLQSGVHVVVGTPGRVMDHLRRGTLSFSKLKTVVLDEADEMLRMGFLEDVEWILEQAPSELQIALFSATMPEEIRRIADNYLTDPVMVEIKQKTLTVPTVEQRYMIVTEQQKLDALTHLLESETVSGEAVLIFARTKIGAGELAEKLQARGYAAEAMHGDMNQAQRESVIRRLRSGQVEIVVATDVAARGWDVERITLVVNYDAPYDSESYIHRIGRTGRAGRAGKAILFVTPREQRMLRDIERYTRQKIDPIKAPTKSDIAARRITLFKERILKTVEAGELDLYLSLVSEIAMESGHEMAEIAAAAARLAQGDKSLEVVSAAIPDEVPQTGNNGMARLFIETGRDSGVRPTDIVGAIANESGIPGNVIGAIDIFDYFTLVDIPARYVRQVLDGMANAAIRGHDAKIRLATPNDERMSGGKKNPMNRPKGKKLVPPGRKRFRQQ